ncbi:MAG: LytTR family DNA-binding domain-containing protein [Fibromonadaceae bacterium]|jgi:two-component system LytT family response regulator|nr:LytTR family DNA-binding domain-containing protein [Fibromonadaceae bacterium]
MKVLVVDDEPLARVGMRKLLLACGKELEIDEAENADKAFAKIAENKPFAVFLDIQMPDKGGFELLEDLSKVSPEELPYIIFATAFDEYAIKAFEKNAIDYLLKPVELERLKQTVEKLFTLKNSKKQGDGPAELYEKLKSLIETKDDSKYLQKLKVKIGGRTLLINIADIVRFESDEKYTTVYTNDAHHIIDIPLIDLEHVLPPKLFLRVHRANLVAVSRIIEIRRLFPGKISVVLNDSAKTIVPVGRNYVERVKDL